MKLTKRNAVQFLLYLLLTAGLVIVVMPFCYMISTSLKPNGALYEFPPHFSRRLRKLHWRIMITYCIRGNFI